jgi:tRNA modification GTPase
MDFIHPPYDSTDTIAAIATPPGEGGVAIIRISGQRALEIASRLFSGPVRSYQSHTAHFGRVIDAQAQTVDEALLLPMHAPRSYTGEDTVEIHCHGGSLIAQRVLETALSAGARPARPGEFTFRAFMNGKIDLSQAEAVQTVIGAKSQLALDTAQHQLQGRLSERVLHLQTELTNLAAVLEAWVDFPEEGLEFMTMEALIKELEHILSMIQSYAETFHEGKRIHSGISLCLIGPPNAGKSSLMNALLGSERAIVTAIPGTTRDLIEEDMRLGALHFRLIDTAGIRSAEEIIEQEGIRRSREALRAADVILLVLDASAPLSSEAEELVASCPREKSLLVWNKIDLTCTDERPFLFPHTACVSAREKIGLDALKEEIDKLVWSKGPPSKEEIVITSSRHHSALKEAEAALSSLIRSLQTEVSAEFAASDMRAALNALGSIIGTNITEDILSAIFSKFCVGK